VCAVLHWRTVHMQGARVHRFAALLCDVLQLLFRSLSACVCVCLVRTAVSACAADGVVRTRIQRTVVNVRAHSLRGLPCAQFVVACFSWRHFLIRG
jgi:hypothetical protein